MSANLAEDWFLEVPPANTSLATSLDNAAAQLMRLDRCRGRRLKMLAFGLKYFPHYCQIEPSRFHRELCEDLDAIIAAEDGILLDEAAPRGNAKTTWATLIYVAYNIVHDLKWFVVLISDTSTQANALLADIKHELEDNEELAADFPHATGRGDMWRDDQIVTKNGRRVLALGTGKRIRGRKHHEHRPDLVVIDDLENDEHVRNGEQRDKVHRWLLRAVLKAKGPKQKFDVVMLGTILHFDSVLARLQDKKLSPGWRSRKYKAVIKWSERQDLWDQWQRIYTDFHVSDETRLGAADAFFKGNEAEMLRGTEVLWPEGEPYYTLMKMRVDEGPAAFDSEKQNEPIDPSTCFFQEQWFQWFDEIEIDGEMWLVPDKGEQIRLAECDVFGACDPSMGKQNKHNDFSCIASIAAYPARRLWKSKDNWYRSFWILDADEEKIPPTQIEANILERHRQRQYVRFGIEAVQFQELWAEDVQEGAFERPGTGDLHIVKLNPRGDKALRIQKLQPFIYSGRLKWSLKITTAYKETVFHGQHDHDDGPDAIEQCLETIGAIGWVNLMDEPKPEQPKSAALQQIEQHFPVPFQPALEGTCGSCVNFQPREGRPGLCMLRNFGVTKELAACEYYQVDGKE